MKTFIIRSLQAMGILPKQDEKTEALISDENMAMNIMIAFVEDYDEAYNEGDRQINTCSYKFVGSIEDLLYMLPREIFWMQSVNLDVNEDHGKEFISIWTKMLDRISVAGYTAKDVAYAVRQYNL